MTDQMAWEEWAKYYDLMDADRSPFIRFYGGLVESSVRSLLDVACGTGIITSALANRFEDVHGSLDGIRIVGADEAPSMLDAARARDRRIRWIRADMREPLAGETFDLVTCCYNTMQQMLAEADFVRAASAAAQMLSPNGRYAFDVYQPNPAYLARPAVDHLARSVRHPDGRTLEIRESRSYDEASRVLSVDWKLIEQGRPGTILARAQYPFRQYSHAELERLLERAGLRIDAVYGDFDRSAFTPQSKKQIVVCRRAARG